jgi:predicted NAD-dependent protein-ADP-ribosyltransferase YbiA (DUF1768 family)
MELLQMGWSKHDENMTSCYRRAECAAFRKTSERWGAFSNMAGGFPLVVNNVKILTSEALYQACRFPHLPEVQREILRQASPMAAKMKSKPHRQNSRPDFDELRVSIMWWSLRVKLACNWFEFSQQLLASGELPIVEDSHKDTFWGAKQAKLDGEVLVGQNVLGGFWCGSATLFGTRTAQNYAVSIRRKSPVSCCWVSPSILWAEESPRGSCRFTSVATARLWFLMPRPTMLTNGVYQSILER